MGKQRVSMSDTCPVVRPVDSGSRDVNEGNEFNLVDLHRD